MPAVIVEKGMVFGRYTIQKILSKQRVYCECSCGTKKSVSKYLLVSGNTKSCGCLNKDAVKERSLTHGLYKDPMYRIYKNMVSRCYSDKHISYPNYGGRGIKVCKEWLGPQGLLNFYNWNKRLPKDKQWAQGLELDRENNDKHYTPKNCRWITNSQNKLNSSRTIMVSYKGKKHALKSLYDLRKDKSLSYEIFRSRVRRNGWSVEKALNTPATLTKS